MLLKRLSKAILGAFCEIIVLKKEKKGMNFTTLISL